MILSQKKLGEHRSFEMLEDSLKVITRNKGVYNEVFISYENITDEVRFLEIKHVIYLICSLITFLIPFYLWWLSVFGKIFGTIFDGIMCSILFVFLGVVNLVAFHIDKKSDFMLMCNDNTAVYFFSDKPNKSTTEEFIKLVIKKKNEYIKNKYTVLDKDLNIEKQIANLYALKLNEIITEDEYVDLKKSIKLPTNSVGFLRDS